MSEQQEQRDYEALNADTALRLNKAQQRITALEAEIKDADSYHNGEHLKDAHRINALEGEKAELVKYADKADSLINKLYESGCLGYAEDQAVEDYLKEQE